MPKSFNLSLRRGRRSGWTAEKSAIARNMRLAGEPDTAIAKVVGFTTVTVWSHLADVPRPEKTPRAPYPHEPREANKAPESVLDERTRRLEAANTRNFTSTFFGDPPPGYSALDKRRAGA